MALELNSLEAKWEKLTSPIARDLKLNFRKIALESDLAPEEAAMVALAVANAVGNAEVSKWARASLIQLGQSSENILEAEESAALMGMLNSYYKFRSFVTKSDRAVAELYSQAGLRMTALARPQIGKERFELLALAVSVVNGCETCVVAHEKTLRDAGVAATKIHDAVRLASVIKGLSKLDFEI